MLYPSRSPIRMPDGVICGPEESCAKTIAAANNTSIAASKPANLWGNLIIYCRCYFLKYFIGRGCQIRSPGYRPADNKIVGARANGIRRCHYTLLIEI